MAIIIRRAEKADAHSMWNLVKELAIFERAPNEVITTPESFSNDLDKHYHAFVAEEKGEVIGMALFYPIYSTWKGHSYYLEDIIINEAHRRKKAGSLLFEAVIEFAKVNSAGRLGWQVLDWNTPAIEFYKRYNAELDDEWITCRIRFK